VEIVVELVEIEVEVRPSSFRAACARENVRLVDAAGATVAAFVFEEVAEGGALRLGKGKLTATLNAPEPKVRYWPRHCARSPYKERPQLV
jgi:hypothetical protein